MKITNQKQPLSPYRQRKYDSMVQIILDTAREIIREHGVAALSMQEIGRRMGIRAPSLYHYFQSKMEIYDSLFQLGFTLYAEHMKKYYQDIHTWQDYVSNSFQGYLSYAKQNPELYQICFERHVPGFEPSIESLQISYQLLSQSYQRVQELKETIHSELSAQQIVDLLITMMHGITAMHMSNEPETPIGQGRFGSLIPVTMALLNKAWS